MLENWAVFRSNYEGKARVLGVRILVFGRLLKYQFFVFPSDVASQFRSQGKPTSINLYNFASGYRSAVFIHISS